MLEDIKKLVAIHGDDVQCYKFHLLLKNIKPEAVPFYTGNHVMSFIEGRFWDKTGCTMYPLDAEPAIKKTLIKAMDDG